MVWSLLYITISILALPQQESFALLTTLAVGVSHCSGTFRDKWFDQSIPSRPYFTPSLQQYIFPAPHTFNVFSQCCVHKANPLQEEAKRQREGKEWGLDWRQAGWTMGWLASWCPLRCHCGYDTSAHCHHIIALGFSHESWLVTKFTESVLTTFGDCWCLKSEVWCQRRRLPPFPSRNSVSCQQLHCQYTAAALSKHLFAPADPCRVNERETIVTCLLLIQTC